jgi:hypothetical protein
MKTNQKYRNHIKKESVVIFLMTAILFFLSVVEISAQETKKSKDKTGYDIDNKTYNKITRSLLKPTDDQLREIGFTINEDSVFFDARYKGKGKIRHISFLNDKDYFGTNLSLGNVVKSKNGELPDYVPIAILKDRNLIFDINVDEGKPEVIPLLIKGNPNLNYPGDVIILLLATEELKRKLSTITDDIDKYIIKY